MASQIKSRWADDEEDAALEAQRKCEKEAKKRAKVERQRKLEEEELRRQEAVSNNTGAETLSPYPTVDDNPERPSKRRRLSSEFEISKPERQPIKLLRFPAPEWGPCRHVDNFEKLNHIEEGSYGWVSRAKEITTGEVVALKKLKMDTVNDGFPVTGLREIQTLMASRHMNIVTLREVVMGDKLDEYVLAEMTRFCT